ncbi:50S ribosomal protein L16 [candidate division WOR-3 bacterium]|nr:50S ribosomal protein L16 [candidate division WOR-3 bacterium]
MLMPKRVKFRKQHRGRRTGKAKGGNFIAFGDWALQALEPGWITNHQIESCRIAITRYFKRSGKVWLRIFPDKPVTKKPAETRMGKGKGDLESWVSVVKPGKILFELAGMPENEAREAMRLGASKLPIKTRFLTKLRKAV